MMPCDNQHLKNKIKGLKEHLRSLSQNNAAHPLIEDFLHYLIDPSGVFYHTPQKILEEKIANHMGNKVAAINTSEIDLTRKSLKYDPILEAFVQGSGGIISSWDKEQYTDNALVIRGVSSSSQQAILHCIETHRDFYAVDTGYFGNHKKKVVHRVTKNALQYQGIFDFSRTLARAEQFGYKYKKFSGGSKILIVPPSEKIMNFYNQPSPQQWVEQVTLMLSQYTDRPIEVRLKPSRSERVTSNTIQSALANDVHCLITYNSIAAVEAVMEGKPAIVLGKNAASPVTENCLSKVETPFIPTQNELDVFMATLAYQQFTVDEMKSGTAWKLLHEGC